MRSVRWMWALLCLLCASTVLADLPFQSVKEREAMPFYYSNGRARLLSDGNVIYAYSELVSDTTGQGIRFSGYYSTVDAAGDSTGWYYWDNPPPAPYFFVEVGDAVDTDSLFTAPRFYRMGHKTAPPQSADSLAILPEEVYTDHLADSLINETRLIKSDFLTSEMIKDFEVSGPDLAPNAFDSTKVIDGGLTGDDFRDGSIPDSKLENPAGSPTGLDSTNVIDGGLTGDDFRDGSIPDSKLENPAGSPAGLDSTNAASGGFAASNAQIDDGKIWVGNSSNVGHERSVTGDITISNTGVTAVGASKINSNMILDGTIGADDVGIGGIGSAEVLDGDLGAVDLGTDAVSADELNATGVEAELEAVLDLSELQGSVTAGQLPSLADGNVWIGSGAAAATNRTMSGDATISNTGVLTIGTSAVGSSEITDGEIVIGDLNSTAFGFVADSLTTEWYWPEYPNAVLDSLGTGALNNGTMAAELDSLGSGDYHTVYEWIGDDTSLNVYCVHTVWTVPTGALRAKDLTYWFRTNDATTGDNFVRVWTRINGSASTLQIGSLEASATWDSTVVTAATMGDPSPGDQVIVTFEMGSKSTGYAKIGKLKLRSVVWDATP